MWSGEPHALCGLAAGSDAVRLSAGRDDVLWVPVWLGQANAAITSSLMDQCGVAQGTPGFSAGARNQRATLVASRWPRRGRPVNTCASSDALRAVFRASHCTREALAERGRFGVQRRSWVALCDVRGSAAQPGRAARVVGAVLPGHVATYACVLVAWH